MQLARSHDLQNGQCNQQPIDLQILIGAVIMMGIYSALLQYWKWQLTLDSSMTSIAENFKFIKAKVVSSVVFKSFSFHISACHWSIAVESLWSYGGHPRSSITQCTLVIKTCYSRSYSELHILYLKLNLSGWNKMCWYQCVWTTITVQKNYRIEKMQYWSPPCITQSCHFTF